MKIKWQGRPHPSAKLPLRSDVTVGFSGITISVVVKFSGCDSDRNQTAITHTTIFSSITISSLNKYWYSFKCVWLCLTWYEPKISHSAELWSILGSEYLHMPGWIVSTPTRLQQYGQFRFEVRVIKAELKNAPAEILRFLRSELQAVKNEIINRTPHGYMGSCLSTRSHRTVSKCTLVGSVVMLAGQC